MLTFILFYNFNRNMNSFIRAKYERKEFVRGPFPDVQLNSVIFNFNSFFKKLILFCL